MTHRPSLPSSLPAPSHLHMQTTRRIDNACLDGRFGCPLLRLRHRHGLPFTTYAPPRRLPARTHSLVPAGLRLHHCHCCFPPDSPALSLHTHQSSPWSLPLPTPSSSSHTVPHGSSLLPSLATLEMDAEYRSLNALLLRAFVRDSTRAYGPWPLSFPLPLHLHRHLNLNLNLRPAPHAPCLLPLSFLPYRSSPLVPALAVFSHVSPLFPLSHLLRIRARYRGHASGHQHRQR